MAAYDYWYWQDSIKNIMPKLNDGSDATATIQPDSTTSTFKTSPKGSCKGTYNTSLCLITTWGRTNSRVGRKKADGTVLTIDKVLLKDATFYLEVTP
jgi:hypothetical protein